MENAKIVRLKRGDIQTLCNAWELHNSAMGRDTLALFDNTSPSCPKLLNNLNTTASLGVENR